MTTASVVVVGAGSAGLAAAAAAAHAGAEVTLLEERDAAGGQLLYRVQPIEAGGGQPTERPGAIRERLVGEALDAGVRFDLGALVAGAFSEFDLLVVKGERGFRLRADALVVATGSTDLPYPFAGATFPGVFSARAVQIMLNQWRVRPGRRFAVVGAGEMADELAVDILLAGGEVSWSGIAPPPFLRAEGEEGVRALTIGPERVEVDVIAIVAGRQPDAGLARMLGAPVGFAAALGGLTPLLDARMQAGVPGLFVAGDAAGAGSVHEAITEGRLAGVAAAAFPGHAGEGAVSEALDAGGAALARRIAEREALVAVPGQPYA